MLGRRAAVDLGERDEPLRQAADDRERHRQPERAGPVRRLGRAADRDPHGQRLLHRPRVDAEHLLTQLQQPHELLLEEPVVVGEVVAEERERLDERATSDHDLGTAAREQVDGRKLLEDADRIVGAEHVDCAREPDPLRPHRGSREDGRGGRDGEVGAVVLPDAEDVEPDLVGELDLLDQVPQTLLRVEARRQLREGVDPELHGRIVAVRRACPTRAAPSTHASGDPRPALGRAEGEAVRRADRVPRDTLVRRLAEARDRGAGRRRALREAAPRRQPLCRAARRGADGHPRPRPQPRPRGTHALALAAARTAWRP